MVKLKTLNRERLLILIPNFVGYSGDVVNEVQLVKHLCRERTCIMLGFTRESKLRLLRGFLADLRRNEWARNSLILPLPILRPYTVSLLLASILLVPFIFLLDKLKPIRFIYVRSSPLASALMIIPSLARKTCVKIPAIFEDEEKSLGRLFAFIHKLADWLVLDRAGCICTPSPLLLREIALRRGVSPKGKVVWVPAGVDREKIENIRRQAHYRINVREEYVVGFIGFLEWWQGMDILVYATAKIKNLLDRPIKLLIVGDGPERRKIEKLCWELGVNCHITGFVKHEEAFKYMRKLDVLVLPSVKTSTTSSNIPIKVIEAWALGIPVISTKHEIYKWLGLKDMEDLLFSEPKPSDVSRKILMALKDEKLRRKLSEKGQLLAEMFYYDKIVSRIFNALGLNE